MSFSRCSPRSRNSNSPSRSAHVVSETTTCPPWPAAAIRAAPAPPAAYLVGALLGAFDALLYTLLFLIVPDAFSGDQLGLINISIGETRHPEVERAILDEVGSYGRQLGHIGDALEVLIAHFDPSALTECEKDALAILKGELAEIRQVMRRTLAGDP